VTLRRERGKTLAPRYLYWSQLGGRVRNVLVNGVEASFEEARNDIRVELPAFGVELRVEIVR
jgi:hypothetical protein